MLRRLIIFDDESESCLSQVSLRRQEIADRLNAWTIFNDKNKEFCDWLTQMENKVCRSGDLSIEEMVEKLKKVRDLENMNILPLGFTGFISDKLRHRLEY